MRNFLDLFIFLLLWSICCYVVENVFSSLPPSIIMGGSVIIFLIINSLSYYLAGKIVKGE